MAVDAGVQAHGSSPPLPARERAKTLEQSKTGVSNVQKQKERGGRFQTSTEGKPWGSHRTYPHRPEAVPPPGGAARQVPALDGFAGAERRGGLP
jgi:hypothetical protein